MIVLAEASLVYCFYFDLFGDDIVIYPQPFSRVESVNLRIVDAEKGQGYIISAGKDGFIKYWDVTR